MSLSLSFIVSVILPLCVSDSSDCKHKNISCNDIQAKDPRGFVLPFDRCADIEVSYNGTVIARATSQENPPTWTSAVISMDSSSIVTGKCIGPTVKCINYNGDFVEETCVKFDITEDIKLLVSAETSHKDVISIAVSFAILIVAGMFYCYCKKEELGSTFSGILRSLKSCCCLREGGSQFSDPLRPHEGNASRGSAARDVETQNGDFSLVYIPTHEPHGSGGNEQDNTTGSVQALRNLNDDPGGASAGRSRTMTLNNGCTHGDRGPEGRPLLLDQRAAVHGSDMTTEAVALVNKHDFDPDEVSRCCPAEDNDMESNP